MGRVLVSTDVDDGGFVAWTKGDPTLLGEGQTRMDAVADWACRARQAVAPRKYQLAEPAKWMALHLSRLCQ